MKGERVFGNNYLKKNPLLYCNNIFYIVLLMYTFKSIIIIILKKNTPFGQTIKNILCGGREEKSKRRLTFITMITFYICILLNKTLLSK